MNPGAKEDLTIEYVDLPSGSRIIRPSGVLTIRTLFDFQNMARRETRSVIIDLADVAYMDSAGLGCVIGLFTSCQRNHRGFGLINVAGRIKTLFQVAHVDTLLPCFASVEAAEAEFLKIT